MYIKVKRGVEANRVALTPLVGEPIFTTDDNELFIGDGVSSGGIPVGTIKPSGNIVADTIAMFKDSTGKLLYSVTKSSLFAGYAKETFVTSTINSLVPTVKVNRAALADKATDADTLKGRSDYLNTDALTNSYTEDNASKVVTARGIKALWVTITDSLVSKASITNSISTDDPNKVLSARAGKTLNDRVTHNTNSITTTNGVISAANSALTINKLAIEANKAHLTQLSHRISKGSIPPSGGSDGDLYLQY